MKLFNAKKHFTDIVNFFRAIIINSVKFLTANYYLFEKSFVKFKNKLTMHNNIHNLSNPKIQGGCLPRS